MQGTTNLCYNYNMLYEGPEKLSAHDICWCYHEDIIPNFLFYKNENGGVFW